MIKKLLIATLAVFTLPPVLNAMPDIPTAREIHAGEESRYAREIKRLQKRDAAKDAAAAQALGFPYVLAYYAGRSRNLVVPGLNEQDVQDAQSRCPVLILDGMGDAIYGPRHMAYRKMMTRYAAQFNALNYRACTGK